MRCAIYCRISRDDSEGEENASIANQKQILTEYAAAQGWELYGVYSDEDRSGADSGRPGFNALLRDAQAGQFEVILCKTQSRFTRDMETVERYLHGLLPRWGVRFVSVADSADTDRKENKKARQIYGLVNEWYLEDLSDSIRLVLDHKRREGTFIGSFAPYGYRRCEVGSAHLEPDPAAAKVVEKIFRMAAGGAGMQRIADALNVRGIPNPTEYKRLCGLRYRNGAQEHSVLWNRATIRRIILHETYAGTMVQGKRKKESYKSGYIRDLPRKEWIKAADSHEPLVSRELFMRANAALRDRGMRRGSIHIGETDGRQTDAVQ